MDSRQYLFTSKFVFCSIHFRVEKKMTENETKIKQFKNWYFWVQSVFYFFQGILFAGIMHFNTINLASICVLDYELIASVSAIILIPTFLKMFPGLLSDRVPLGKFGRRKPYIVLGIIISIIGYAILPSIKSYSWVYVIVIMTILIGWVFIDGSLDALTVDITPSEKTDKMQGFAVMGRMLGYAVGSFVVVLIAGDIGWTLTIYILGAAAVIQGFVGLLYHEPNAVALLQQIPLRKAFKKTFGSIRSWATFLFMVCMSITGGASSLVGSYILHDLGWGGSDLLPYYGLATLLMMISAAVASITFGFILSKIKNKVLYFIIVGVSVWLSILPVFGLIWIGSVAMVFITFIGLGFAMGISTVVSQIQAQKECPPSIEGFYFSTLTSFMNFGQGALASLIFGATIGIFGVIQARIVLLPFTIVAVILGIFISQKRDKSKEEELAAKESEEITAKGIAGVELRLH